MSTDYEANLIQPYEHWNLYLHENQRYLGRTYAALNRPGEIDPFIETTSVEQQELVTIFRGLSTVLEELYQPTRLNYANLRNTWHHCHWHVIPRYDTPRNVHGVRFVDQNVGRNYAPAKNLVLPDAVQQAIKTDIQTGLQLLHEQ